MKHPIVVSLAAALVAGAVVVHGQAGQARGAGRRGGSNPNTSTSPATSPLTASVLVPTSAGTDRRTAHYYPGASRQRPVPLVIVFHGHGQSGRIANTLFQIEDAWPEAFVAYPDGIGGIPDNIDLSGTEPGWQKDAGQLEDRDLKFFDKMIETIRSTYQIDTSKVYVAGFSNGARFTYLLWQQRRDVLAAIAAFSSQAVTNDLYKTLQPLPAMAGNGLRDERVTYREAAASFSHVVEVNKAIVDTTGRTGREIGIFTYPAGAGGAETVQWTYNGIHEPPRNPGPDIVTFFKRHAR